MKKILSILLAVSLMTMSLGSVNAQIKDTAVRKDMAAQGGATTTEEKPIKSQAKVKLTAKPISETYATTAGVKSQISAVTTDTSDATKLTGLTLSEDFTDTAATLNLTDLSTGVSVPTTVTTIKSLIIKKASGTDLNTKIETLVIPSHITNIESNAFQSMTALKKIIILKDSTSPVTGDSGHGSTSGKVRYQDQMPTIDESKTTIENKDATKGYAKKVVFKAVSTANGVTDLKVKNSSNSDKTTDGFEVSTNAKIDTISAVEETDGFETKYDAIMEGLGSPFTTIDAQEVSLTEAEIKAATTEDLKNALKTKILTNSKLKIVDADTEEEIKPTISDEEFKKLNTTDFSKSIELNASCVSKTNVTQNDIIKVKITPTATTPDQPTQPEKVTLETLKAKITEAEALKSSDYTGTTFEALTKAIEAAKKINDKSTEEDIKTAYEALVKAIDGLRKPVKDTITTESGNTVTATEIPSTSNDYKKVADAVKTVDLSVQGAEKFDLTNAKVLQVLDLSVANASANGETVKLKLAKLTDGKKYVLAHFDGTKIDAIYEGTENADGTYSFSGIKSFSPFAVMEVTPKAATNNSTSKNPSTGDSTGIAIFLTLTIASATGAYVVRKKLVK